MSSQNQTIAMKERGRRDLGRWERGLFSVAGIGRSGRGVEDRPMRIVLLGPPGMERGTQAKRIAGKYDLPHLSARDMLRSAALADTRTGKKVSQAMASGKLVDDPVVLAAMIERISQPDAERGFVLDGFPRTMPQAVTFDDLLDTEGLWLDHVIELRVDEKVLLDRLANRAGGVCADRGHETLKARLDAYNEQAASLIEYYRARNILSSIDGSQPAEALTSQLLGLIRSR